MLNDTLTVISASSLWVNDIKSESLNIVDPRPYFDTTTKIHDLATFGVEEAEVKNFYVLLEAPAPVIVDSILIFHRA